MKEFKQILFPTDLSEISGKMVPYVKMMADKFDADIHLLFVCRMFESLKSIYVPHPSLVAMETEVLKAAEIKMKEFIKEFFPGMKPHYRVVLGDTVDEIMNYISKNLIDLVIVGTHGRKGLERFIFGSVAKSVFQRSNVPVMIINPYMVECL
ncbi:MAG: universal stress protein [Desulfobacteraceae bacterium]|nr:universal stress protein [Desulfobacteraceae bacterium]MCB9494325.1 universal stress protein [Desulfobacteraceae bacterium]